MSRRRKDTPSTWFTYEERHEALAICAGLDPADYAEPMTRAVIEKAKAQVAKCQAVSP